MEWRKKGCARCGGRGVWRNGSTCSACEGKGKLWALWPWESCARCEGHGGGRWGRTCNVCQGAGVNSDADLRVVNGPGGIKYGADILGYGALPASESAQLTVQRSLPPAIH